MKTSPQTTFAERAGQLLGRVWRGFARLDRKAYGWLAAHGVARGAANTLLWVVKLALLGVLLYAAFWLALLFLFAVVAAWLAHNSDHDEPEEWAIGEQAEYKNSVFYDPINYNDNTDSRFDDWR